MSAMRWKRALQVSSSLSPFITPCLYSTPLLLSSSLVYARSTITQPFYNSAAYSTWPKEPWLCPASTTFLRAFHHSTQPDLTYKISASYSAKGQRLDPDRNLFTFDPANVQKRVTDNDPKRLSKQNRPRSGQDSFFVGPIGDTHAIAFGVVDGVGGWAESGIDPADFAHSLCEYMAESAKGYPDGLPKGSLHPRDLLEVGYQSVMQDKTIHAGGSTACIGVLEPSGRLEVANLGDSGFIHFSHSAVRHTSDPQTHAFNTPFQLSKIPRKMQAQMSVFGSNSMLHDAPRDAAITTHTLSHGDVLVFASDGVWDNLSPADALAIVNRHMQEQGAWIDAGDGVRVAEKLDALTQEARGESKDGKSRISLQSRIALAVTREAKETSLNSRRDGPFAREVQRYYPGDNWHGGKPDDICVIVVIAVDPAAS